jgi:hypothetical protein
VLQIRQAPQLAQVARKAAHAGPASCKPQLCADDVDRLRQ